MEDTEPSVDEVPSVGTFAFLDFESTDLLSNKPKITELCIVAVHAEDMGSAGVSPRVTNKLNLCFNPMKPISPGSSSITGLYNDNLEHQQKFSATTVTLLNNFLEHLKQPVCLLAHFGNGFDYPLLVAELKRINQSLIASLMCADTLEAFRSLDGLPPRYVPANQSPAVAARPPVQPQVDILSPATPSNRASTAISVAPPCLKRKSEECVAVSPTAGHKVQKSDSFQGTVNALHEATTVGKTTTAGKVRKKLFSDECADDRELKGNDNRMVRHDNTMMSDDIKTMVGDKETKEEVVDDPKDMEFSESFGDEDLITLDDAEKMFFASKAKDIEEENSGTKEGEQKMETCLKNASTAAGERNGIGMESGGKGKQNECSVNDESMECDKQKPDQQDQKRSEVVEGVSEPGRISEDCYSAVNAGSGYIVVSKDIPLVKNIDKTDTNRSCAADKTSSNKDTTSLMNHDSVLAECPDKIKSSGLNSDTFTKGNGNPSSSGEGADPEIKHGNSNDRNESIKNTTDRAPVNDKSASKAGASGANFENSPVQRKSYKLIEIHKRIFDHVPAVSHKAEDDVMALIRVAKCTPGFTEWVAKHMVLFSSITAPEWASTRQRTSP